MTTLLEVLLTGFEGVLESWICQINHTFDILNKEHRQQDYEKFVYYVMFNKLTLISTFVQHSFELSAY